MELQHQSCQWIFRADFLQDGLVWLPFCPIGNGTKLHKRLAPWLHSCTENPRDGGAWWAAVYGVAQSRTRLKRLSSSSSSMLLTSKAQTNLYTNFSRLRLQLSFSTVQLRLFSLIGNLSKRQRGTPGKEQRKKESQFPEALSVSLGLRLMANAQATDPEEIRDRGHLIAWEIWEESGTRATWRPQHLSSAPGVLMGTMCLPLNMLDWDLVNGRAPGLFSQGPRYSPLPIMIPTRPSVGDSEMKRAIRNGGRQSCLKAEGESAWPFNCAKTTRQNRYISNRGLTERVLLKLK